MNDKQFIASLQRVKTTRKALEVMVMHSHFIGSDPYYRDLNNALWEMAERVLEEEKARTKDDDSVKGR